MTLAGTEGQGPERNTSWGGSSNTSWGGSSNTSWGGGRGRAVIAALAVALPVLAALPFAAHSSSAPSQRNAALQVSSGAPVRLDGAPLPSMSSGGRLNVRELSGASLLGNGSG